MCERPSRRPPALRASAWGSTQRRPGRRRSPPPWRRSCPCPLRSARRVSRALEARVRGHGVDRRRNGVAAGGAVPERGRDGVGRRGSASRRSAPARLWRWRAALSSSDLQRRRAPSPLLALPATTANVILYRPRQGGLFCRTDRADVERIESSSTPSRNRRPCAVGGPPIRPRPLNSSATIRMRRCGCLDRRAVSARLAR